MTDRVHGNARLSGFQIREIRQLAKTPCACCGVVMSGPQIARLYGISTPAVHYIVKGRTHARVKDLVE